jgi:hypothetical protein
MRNRVLDGGEGADQVDIEGGTEFLDGKLLDPGPSAIDADIGYNYIEPPQVSLCPAESVVLSVLLRGHCLDFRHRSRCASLTRTRHRRRGRLRTRADGVAGEAALVLGAASGPAWLHG